MFSTTGPRRYPTNWKLGTQKMVRFSQSSYEALHLLRKKARIGAVKWNTAAAAHGLQPEPDVNVPYNSAEDSPLGELERIWTTGFTYQGKQHDPLATCLKNDLGSYAQAVFSK